MFVKTAHIISEIIVAGEYEEVSCADDFFWALSSRPRLVTEKIIDNVIDQINNNFKISNVIHYIEMGNKLNNTSSYHDQWLKEFMSMKIENHHHTICFKIRDCETSKMGAKDAIVHLFIFDNSDIAMLLTSPDKYSRSVGKKLSKLIK